MYKFIYNKLSAFLLNTKCFFGVYWSNSGKTKRLNILPDVCFITCCSFSPFPAQRQPGAQS